MFQTLFDHDTVTGSEPWELLALEAPAVIIPGTDAAHATSAARYLQECIDDSVYHGVSPMDQSPDDLRQWIIEFMEAHASLPTA